MLSELLNTLKKMKNKKVFIVIPNKNGLSHLQYSLPSLIKTNYKNYKIIVVDNNSKDGSVDFIKNNFENITIIHNKRSDGFAGAINSGIIYALENHADLVAIFSNDIKVKNYWLELSVKQFISIDNLGILGFREVLKESPEFFNNHKISDKFSIIKNKSIPGCLYLCNIDIFKKAGLFDESYYMYGEDNDFFHRIIRSNFLIYQSNIPVWHFGEGFSQKNKLLPTWYAYRNSIKFSLKNQTLYEILRMIAFLFHIGCNPFFHKNHNDPVHRRMRRYNIFTNFLLIFFSMLWNILNKLRLIK